MFHSTVFRRVDIVHKHHKVVFKHSVDFLFTIAQFQYIPAKSYVPQSIYYFDTTHIARFNMIFSGTILKSYTLLKNK